MSFAAALLLLALSAQSLLSSVVPTVTCPTPLPLIIPALLGVIVGIPPLFMLAVPSLAFLLWCLPYASDSLIPPRRTEVVFIVVAGAAAFEFALSWDFSIQYHGHFYTQTTALISLFSAVVIAILLIRFRRTTSLPLNLIVNFLLFAWTFTYAFPYLGELP